ncbi:hypothetical protein FH972_021444 [Carpinus fangiana]|uniref:Uncharacterized protein n=1 Tax=Carpinus fangiana TaxID=176857 RepID=A0A5N6KPZ9_9ROSI|nr:hypothetical protein FH972_021444 [Carpinus fangiana]
MPPPKGFQNNFLEGPGDYDVTAHVHSDTYPAIDPLKADLTGKTVFVSGASKGIGRAIVLAFAQAGASNIAAGARSDLKPLEKEVLAAAAAAKRPEPKFLGLKLDVTSIESVQQAADAVERSFGRLDVVINNAGILGKMGPIIDTDPEDWWEVFNVNLRGPYLISRALLPLLLKGGDKMLVHVSSVGALLSMSGGSSYQTSKTAVNKLTEHIHADYAAQGLTTFCVHPGNCQTDIISGTIELDDFGKAIFCDQPQLCADTLVYLTNSKATWLGGRYINVTWDMPELFAKKEEIIGGDKLKNRFVF